MITDGAGLRGHEDPREERPERHRHRRQLRLPGGRQDRHHRQLQRRLVRRLHAGPGDRGLGRLPERAEMRDARRRVRAAPSRADLGRVHDTGQGQRLRRLPGARRAVPSSTPFYGKYASSGAAATTRRGGDGYSQRRHLQRATGTGYAATQTRRLRGAAAGGAARSAGSGTPAAAPTPAPTPAAAPGGGGGTARPDGRGRHRRAGMRRAPATGELDLIAAFRRALGAPGDRVVRADRRRRGRRARRGRSRSPRSTRSPTASTSTSPPTRRPTSATRRWPPRCRTSRRWAPRPARPTSRSALPAGFADADALELARGMAELAERRGTTIAGGDVVARRRCS